MSALAADWPAAARAATEELCSVLAAAPTTAQRARETGTRGEGGDRTLEIDAAAETAVFRRLEGLHADGARFAAVSEERGRVDFGFDPRAPVLVVIDPLDGSRNAKRGLPHFALSLAVAEGDTMADVVFGFVHDFGTDEEWVARRGEGALLNGARLDPGAAERRVGGKRELRGLASAAPAGVPESAAGRPAAAPTASSSCSGSSPPIRPGCGSRPKDSPPRPTACDRSARSPSRSARSPPGGWTAWSRCAAAARSTSRRRS